MLIHLFLIVYLFLVEIISVLSETTIAYLICIKQFIAENLDTNGQDFIYTDFSIAFDKIAIFISSRPIN